MSADGQPRGEFSLAGMKPFFAGATHDEALARLHFLVETHQRCGILIGPTGTGKSTVLRAFADDCLAAHLTTVTVDLTALDAAGLLQILAERLAVTLPPDDRLSTLWREVSDAFAGRRQARRRSIVTFDHVDLARPDCHDVVRRLLADDGSPFGPSFVLAFSGVSFPVVSKEWRQAADLRMELSPLAADETAAFVRSLVDSLNLPRDIFDAGAIQVICDATHGVPQAIVRLCQMALLSATHDESSRISSDVVEAAMRELSSLRCSA